MKAILVIDMPEACWEDCPCEYDMIRCQALNRHLISATADECRPDWCPLRPLPDDRYEENFDWTDLTQKENAAMNHGWNKCLEAILKGVKV